MLHLSLFTLIPIFAGAGIHLVERRGRIEKINPRRQIEIGTLLESMPEAIFLFDSKEKIVDLNATAQQLSGLDRLHALQFDAAQMAHHFGANGHEIDFPKAAVHEALEGHTIREIRRGFRDPGDGHTVEALISASPLRDETGEIVGALIIVRDITEMAQLQRRLADTQKHYAVGQMAASIAHDFNNVLDAINQAVYILETGGDRSPEERQTYLKLIERAVRRGAEISHRVSDYLKTGTGTASSVNLKSVLEDCIELTRPLWSKGPLLKVTWDIGEIPMVCGNASDLRRVFTNLIINAIEAMPHGGSLHIVATRKRDVARIDISDTGQGIKPEHRKRIFSQYFTTKREGTGLGLSSAYHTIMGLKGKLTFKSEVGKGTTFCIEIPLAQGACDTKSERGSARNGDVRRNGDVTHEETATRNGDVHEFRPGEKSAK
jgi:PAS domain S-box-containing protein